jgi:PPOX class probable F420-dependent enzyme
VPVRDSDAMTGLDDSARRLIESGALAHMVTLNENGSPQVAVVWVGLDGDELVSGHLRDQVKLANLRRDPRVALSFEAPTSDDLGLRHYLVVHGVARVTEGGAPELLHRLAQTHLGAGTDFPPMPDPPPGYVVHVRVTRVGGHGPWNG